MTSRAGPPPRGILPSITPETHPMDILTELFAGTNPGRDAPDTMPIQPHPTVARTAALVVAGRPVTALYREWADDDPARCRLCDRCEAARATPDGPPACLFVIARPIGPEAAPLFSTVGFRRYVPEAAAYLAVPHLED